MVEIQEDRQAGIIYNPTWNVESGAARHERQHHACSRSAIRRAAYNTHHRLADSKSAEIAFHLPSLYLSRLLLLSEYKPCSYAPLFHHSLYQNDNRMSGRWFIAVLSQKECPKEEVHARFSLVGGVLALSFLYTLIAEGFSIIMVHAASEPRRSRMGLFRCAIWQVSYVQCFSRLLSGLK